MVPGGKRKPSLSDVGRWVRVRFDDVGVRDVILIEVDHEE